MDSKVYSFIYNYLLNNNKGSKPKYFDEDKIVAVAKRKFGDTDEIEEESSRAFADFYESEYFIKKYLS